MLHVLVVGRIPPIEPGHSAVFLSWDVALDKLAVDGDRHFLARYLRLRSLRPLKSINRADRSSGNSFVPA